MRSLHSDIISTLAGATFSIDDVSVRKPFDESAKHYPMLVVYELNNTPHNHATVNGEARTNLSYQVSVLTQNCQDSDGNALSRWEAGRLLVQEVGDLLDNTYKLTRRSITELSTSADIMEFVWRGEAVLDSAGYSYRA